MKRPKQRKAEGLAHGPRRLNSLLVSLESRFLDKTEDTLLGIQAPGFGEPPGDDGVYVSIAVPKRIAGSKSICV